MTVYLLQDLPAGPQLVFTLNNRFFRHQACYSLLPAKPGGQADRVVSLCKYKVVGWKRPSWKVPVKKIIVILID
jgi:hypothetical protein